MLCSRLPPGTQRPSETDLGVFAQTASLLIENALRDEQQFFLQKLGTVLADEEMAPDSCMDEIAQAIAERMRFEACTIFALTSDTTELRVVGTTGIVSNRPREQWRFEPAEDHRDPVAQVARTATILVSNDLKTEKQWFTPGCEVLPDRVTDSLRQQYLAAPIAATAAEEGPTIRKVVGVLRLCNKRVHPDDVPERPIDLVDLIEVGMLARALSAFLSVVERERIRADVITQIRHDMRDPVNVIRNAAGNYARLGIEAIAEHAKEVHRKLQDIESLCQILYVQIELTRALSYTEIEYDFQPTRMKSDIVVKWNKLFTKECARYKLKGIFADDFEVLRDPIFVDARMMQIVFYNMYQNAIKYSFEGTEIRVTSEADADWFSIHVSNYGIPIREEDRDRVFRKWYRTPEAVKKAGSGLGLGLFTVRQIVERHGGKVEVTSTALPTTITIRLPRWLAERKPKQFRPKE
jgi:signal transduction histidine kinase